MVNKTQYQLTQKQAEKAIQMCLDNARSYLDDTEFNHNIVLDKNIIRGILVLEHS